VKTKNKKEMNNMKKFGLTLLTAFVGGAMALGTYRVLENKYTNSLSFDDQQKVYFASNHLSTAITSSAGEVDFTQAAAAVTPAVVYIRVTYAASQNSGEQDQMQQMFGQMFGQGRGQRMQQAPEQASGSGVIISPDGYIVTNNHVVEKADKIDITTDDHRHFRAKVIGTDPNTDLALIKIDATNLPIVKFGNSDDARVGEWVLAVGNPFNLTSTVTAGIVSAKGRGIGIIGSEDQQDDQQNPFASPARRMQQQPQARKGIESFIQTDAAINPGNSGGALVNTKGELIGINSAIASHTGSYEGYGFAIPINLAKKVLNDIKEYGVVKRGMVGVQFHELNQDAADELKIDRNTGLYVDDVVAGSGAEQAGIKKGDIITKVAGNNAYSSSDLEEPVGRLQPGDKVNLTVLHDGGERNVSVTLKADLPAEHIAAAPKSAEELYNKLGASFTPLTQAQKTRLHVNGGVMVAQVRRGGMFADFDMPVGSVITSINHQPINSVADIDKAITNIRNGIVVIGGIDNDGRMFNNRFQVQ